MAQQGVLLGRDQFGCSVCLDLLKDPVTLPCGHSYCRGCIEACWDQDAGSRVYSCPQCRQSFTPRPALRRNYMLAEVVEKMMETEAQATNKQLSQQKVQQRIQEREKELEKLQQTVESVKRSSQAAEQDSERLFAGLICSIKRRSSEVKLLIRAQQRAAVSQAEGRVERLEQEIAELKKKHTEMETLSHTDDHIHFLQSDQSLSSPSVSPDLSSVSVGPLQFFSDVTKAVSELRDKLEDVIKGEWSNISSTVSQVSTVAVPLPTEPMTRADFLPTEPMARADFLPAEPMTRADLLQYSCRLTLDPNTANQRVSLSEDRKMTRADQPQPYPDHPDRFIRFSQVLCRETLSGRCYWEVEWRGAIEGRGTACAIIAVSYKDIMRTSYASGFGYNNKSWRLDCVGQPKYRGYNIYHNRVRTAVSGPMSPRIGVYLDHQAGSLSFYSISDTDTLTLLHRVQTTFTQPLCPGFIVLDNVEISKLW